MLGSISSVNGSSLRTSRWWKYFIQSRGLGRTVMLTAIEGMLTRVPPRS
jgi:hypothetical protein